MASRNVYTVTTLRVTYPLHVQVLHSLGDGVEDSAGFSLREKLLSQDFVQQLASFHQLRHQVHRAPVVIHLTQENNANNTLFSHCE